MRLLGDDDLSVHTGMRKSCRAAAGDDDDGDRDEEEIGDDVAV